MSSRRVNRSFAFLDLCGFTAHMDEHGDDYAVQALSALRSATRTAAEEHGVRIGKWLGDGAMLVGMEHDPVLQCALGIQELLPRESPPVRGGVSTGPVILFEGDDYVGWAVNIAARLCAAAGPWQILVADHDAQAPAQTRTARPMQVRGLSRPISVRQLTGTRGPR